MQVIGIWTGWAEVFNLPTYLRNVMVNLHDDDDDDDDVWLG
jgi:hypothetical protein